MFTPYSYPVSSLYYPSYPVETSFTANASSSTSGISSFNSSSPNDNYLTNYYNLSNSSDENASITPTTSLFLPVKSESFQYNLAEPRSSSVCSDLGSDNDSSTQATSTPTYQRYLPTNYSYYQNHYGYNYYQNDQFYPSNLAYPQTDNYSYDTQSVNQANLVATTKETLNVLKEQSPNVNSSVENKNLKKCEEKKEKISKLGKDLDGQTINCNDINFKYPSSAISNPNVKVTLQDIGLWTQFKNIGTEMIITKTGRRMFPSIRVKVSGLNPTSKYIMFIDVVPFDDNRYRYQNAEWTVTGKSEPHFAGLAYLHPDSPMSGSNWMKETISFHKLKLTNNQCDKNGLVNFYFLVF